MSPARIELVAPDTRLAPALAALMRENRVFLEPFEPLRPESFFTEEGALHRLAEAAEAHRLGLRHLFLILEDGDPVGTIALSNIVRGPLQGANVGYFVAERANGRGIATRAVGEVVRIAFNELGLERVEAGTLLSNGGSQAVLRRNGFRPIGIARGYLEIAGRRQDHLLFELNRDEQAISPPPVAVDVRIRPAQRRDAGPLARLVAAVAAERPAVILEPQGGAGEERSRIRAADARPESALLLVAEEGGRIVARLEAIRQSNRAASHVAEVGLIVAADQRRTGIGGALLPSALDWAERVGVRKLEIHVLARNSAALAFWRRHGFDEEGIRWGRFRLGEEDADAVLMARPTSPPKVQRPL